jgi:hypothetical protein
VFDKKDKIEETKKLRASFDLNKSGSYSLTHAQKVEMIK